MRSNRTERARAARGPLAALMVASAVCAAGSMAVGCASAPQTRPEQAALQTRALGALDEMIVRDPSLRQVVDGAYGYVVFPSVGEGAFLVGGGQGVGVVFEQGRPIGTARITQASVGLQVGGQTYSELIVFRSKRAFGELVAGSIWDMRADATATALSAGASGSAHFDDDVAVFVLPDFGAMAAISVGGQQMRYAPLV